MKKTILFTLMFMICMTFCLTTETYAASKPAKVTSVKVSQTADTKVTVTWKKAKRAKKYVVYRSKDGDDFTKVKTTNKRKFVNTITAGDTYYYKVRGLNGKTKGAVSKSVMIETVAPAEPEPTPEPTPVTSLDAPTNVKVTTTESTMTVTWDAVENASYYEVMMSSYSADSKFKLVEQTANTTCTVSGLPEKSGRYFRVYAVNGEVKSKASQSVFGKTTVAYVFETNKNVKLPYGSTEIYVGENWSSSIDSALKSGSSGSASYSRYKVVAHDGQKYTMSTYFYDIGDYDNFLAVYVANGQIIKWTTNGDVMCVANGTTISKGSNASYTNKNMFVQAYTTVAKQLHIAGQYPTDGMLMGGASSGYSVSGIYESDVNINNEKTMSMYFVNAFRKLDSRGLGMLKYNKYMDGTGYTYTGPVYSSSGNGCVIGNVTNAGIGAQAMAETVYYGMVDSELMTHSVEKYAEGPIAMGTGTQWDTTELQADIKKYGSSSLRMDFLIAQVANGNINFKKYYSEVLEGSSASCVETGEVTLTSYTADGGSGGHLYTLLNEDINAMGVGIFNGVSCIQVGYAY